MGHTCNCTRAVGPRRSDTRSAQCRSAAKLPSHEPLAAVASAVAGRNTQARTVAMMLAARGIPAANPDDPENRAASRARRSRVSSRDRSLQPLDQPRGGRRPAHRRGAAPRLRCRDRQVVAVTGIADEPLKAIHERASVADRLPDLRPARHAEARHAFSSPAGTAHPVRTEKRFGTARSAQGSSAFPASPVANCPHASIRPRRFWNRSPRL